MKYHLTFPEWNEVPREKKLEFWKAVGVNEPDLDSAQFIPTLIQMIEYLEGQDKETLCDDLWKKCLLKLK